MQRRQLREQKRSTRWVKRHCPDRSSTGTNRNDEEPTTTRDGIRATNDTVASNSIIKVDTIHSNSGTTAHNSILRTGTTEAHMEGQMQEVTLVAATAVITTGRADVMIIATTTEDIKAIKRNDMETPTTGDTTADLPGINRTPTAGVMEETKGMILSNGTPGGSQISKTYCSSKEAEAATIRSMHSNQAMETTSILSPKDRDRRSGISKGIT